MLSLFCQQSPSGAQEVQQFGAEQYGSEYFAAASAPGSTSKAWTPWSECWSVEYRLDL